MTDTDNGKWEEMVEAGARVRAIQKFGDPWHMLLPAQQDHCKVQVAAILQAAGVKKLVEAVTDIKPFLRTWLTRHPKNDGYGFDVGTEHEGHFTRQHAAALLAAVSDNGRG